MISDSFRRQLANQSRDRNFLIRSALLIVVVAVIVSFIVSRFFAYGVEEKLSEKVSLRMEVSEEKLISFIRFGIPLLRTDNAFHCLYLKEDWDRSLHLKAISEQVNAGGDGPNHESIKVWTRAISSGKPEAAIRTLEEMPADLRWRKEFLGDLFVLTDQHDRAQEAFLASAERPEASDYTRRSAVALAHYNEDKALLKELLADSSFRDAFTPGALLDYYAYLRDYPNLAVTVAKAELGNWQTPYLIPALITAVIWGIILNSFWVPSRTRVIMSFTAFVLGIFSATLTLFAVVIQEDIGGFVWSQTDTDLSQFLYFLVGVALREETLKLLCFVPLLFWLKKNRNPVESLVLAGMVGLGFAVNENIGYFQRSDGDSLVSWVRLLTANPLHFALTGVAGFYLARMVERRGHGMEEFLIAFIAVVFAHGVYNAVLSIPSLQSYSPLSTILVAVIAYQYFDRLRASMDTYQINRRISPLGVFVLGSAFLTSLAMLTSAASQPMMIAFASFATGVAAMIPLAFAFISRFRDL